MVFIRCGILVLLFLLLRSSIFAAISFSISNPTYENEVVSVEVSLSGLTTSSCASSSCYLQAGLKNLRTNRYFGFTKNDRGEWIVYNSSTDKTTIQSTFFTFSPTGGNWSGKVSAKADPNDTDYEGPGSYGLKLWRYSGGSDGSAGDPTNEVSVALTGPTLIPTNTLTPTQTPTDAPINTSTCTPKPSNTSTPTLTKTPTGKPSTTSTIVPTGTQDASESATEHIGEPNVLGVETASREAGVSSQSSRQPLIITFIFLGAGCALLCLAFTFRKTFMR